MARPLRIEYGGALYHITARGNERNPIYREEGDYQRFIDILSELPQRYNILIHQDWGSGLEISLEISVLNLLLLVH